MNKKPLTKLEQLARILNLHHPKNKGLMFSGLIDWGFETSTGYGEAVAIFHEEILTDDALDLSKKVAELTNYIKFKLKTRLINLAKKRNKLWSKSFKNEVKPEGLMDKQKHLHCHFNQKTRETEGIESVDNNYDEERKRRLLNEAIKKLPQHYQDILTRQMEGFKVEEIALRFELTIDQVDHILRRAKKKLKEILGGEFSD